MTDFCLPRLPCHTLNCRQFVTISLLGALLNTPRPPDRPKFKRVIINPRSTGVSSRARHAHGGGGGKYYLPPPANSQSSSRSEVDKAAIEISQRGAFSGIYKENLKRITSQVRARSKIKIVPFRPIGCRDGTNNCWEPKLCQKAFQRMKKVAFKNGIYIKSRSRSRSGQIKVTKRKCCMRVMRHIFYGSFGTQNSMVAFICKFGPKKCQ